VQPAILFPTAADRNHTPIIKPRIRAGASLVTTLRPTGLRLSSPSSSMKYAKTSHHGLTRMPVHRCAAAPAGTRRRTAMPAKSSPIATVAGLEGSRLPNRTHSQARIGARRITNNAGTDWNHEDGNEYPNTDNRVYRSAKRFSVDPACSYAPQNNDAK